MSIGSEPLRVPRIEDQLERHRVALTRHCARMLGSPSEAEDAVQETLLRAWVNHRRFEGRSALRSWLHRIATNVCIDMLNDRSRRAVPVDPAPLESASLVASAEYDPAEQTVARETFRLALLAALERLPARQRAVLLLREGLCWRASEVAELLGTSSAAVNSALQRARAALDSTGAGDTTAAASTVSRQRLLACYLAAFKAYDIPARRRVEMPLG
jgi:RNA polymerase sigma-70 factor (ECF subfamily)